MRKWALSPVGEAANITTTSGLSDPSMTASVILSIQEEGKPLFIDLRESSNTSQDFCTFITLAVAGGFLKPGDTLVYDNAAVHFAEDTFEELQALLHSKNIETIRLPTYSPELNPIERCFGVVKSRLRYHRGTGSLLEEVIDAFSHVTTRTAEKEYLLSCNYNIKHPMELPPGIINPQAF